MALALRRTHHGTPAPAQQAGVAVLLLLAIVCVAAARPHHSPERSAAALPSGAAVPITTIGLATFYADDFDGQVMANGSVFDMNDPTIAAANAWPLGTRLEVRRVPGGPWDATLTPAEHEEYFSRTITVTVSDRGAFTHALDLSRGAFALLGRPDEGVIRVAIEPVAPAEPPASVALNP